MTGVATPTVVAGDRHHASLKFAVAALARCLARAAVLLLRHAVRQPRRHVDEVLCFADGTHGRVYRETVVRDAPTDEPVLLVVGFRLRWVRGRGHALFRAESLLNTPLFVGFPGLVSKLWVADDESGRYRGVYQWNGVEQARAYVQALWWVLALVSERDSIHYAAVSGLGRDEVLADPSVLTRTAGPPADEWWRLTNVSSRATGASG